jgi:DNA-binding response OmpR family regulator
MKKRVLLIDNDPLYLETRKESLEEVGYFVLTAVSLEEARDILRRKYIHLAAIDVRMVNEESDRDTSGLKLARDPEFVDIVKIIVTGYDRDPDDVNDTLEPTPDRRTLPPAVRFLAKDEGLQQMVDRIGKAIANYTGINWSLAFNWPSPNFALDLAAWLGGSTDDEWRERSEELTDLLAMAFYDFDRIRIDRLLWHTGPRLALAVTAWRDDAIVDRVAVISLRSSAVAHGSTMPERAPEGHAQYVRLSRPARTLHYTADLYEPPGGRLDQLRTLRQYYADSKPTPLGNCVSRLLENGLAPWNQPGLVDDATDADMLLRVHARLAEDAPASLDQVLRRTGKTATQAGAATLSVVEDRMLIRSLHRPDLELPHPAAWLAQPGPARFKKPLALGESYGSPPPDTILVAPDGRSWLTDFSGASQAPLLSVLADLETLFIYDLHSFQNPTEFVDATEKLLFSTILTHHLEPPSAELKKLFIAIQQIRKRAARYGGGVAYFRSLFYHTTRRLLAMPWEEMDRGRSVLPPLCACLGLGLLARRLNELQQATTEAPPAYPGLRVDEASRRCFLNDTLVSLPATPYRFLLYLWHHRRQHCDNTDIMAFVLESNVWDANYPAQLVQTIRAALGSLGKQYLVNSGRGYTLYPDGRPDRPV